MFSIFFLFLYHHIGLGSCFVFQWIHISTVLHRLKLFSAVLIFGFAKRYEMILCSWEKWARSLVLIFSFRILVKKLHLDEPFPLDEMAGRSPHSSFYRGTGAYRPHLPPPPPPPTSMSVSSTSTSLLYPTMAHKRQGSYDSGIQGSEPSDGEVFV